MRSVVPINHLASPPLYTRCPCIHTGRVRSVDTTIRTIARDTNRGRGGLNRAVTWTQTRSTASYGRNIRRYCSPRIRAEWKRTRIVVAATTKPASQRSIITVGYASRLSIQPSIRSHLNEVCPRSLSGSVLTEVLIEWLFNAMLFD